MTAESEQDAIIEGIATADNEQELAERVARLLDFICGSSFEHRIEAYRSDEFLTNDQIIRLNSDDRVWLLTVQEYTR
jgi:hypothetical protein